MLGAAPLIAALTLCVSASDVKNPALAEGIRLYDALDFAGALQSLTQALDTPSNKRDSARIHLYIGLIQYRFKQAKDAEASFGKALDYDAGIKPPKATPPAAKALFKKVQKAKYPDEVEPRPQADKKKKTKQKKASDDDDEGIEYMSSGPSNNNGTTNGTARTSSAALPSNALAMNDGAIRTTDQNNPRALPGVRSNPPPSQQQQTTSSLTQPTKLETNPDSGGPIAGWIAIGAGVAAVATGVTLGILSAKNGAEAVSEPVASRAEQLHSTAVQQRTLSFVSFGVSGVALGVAAILFLTE